MKLFHFLFLPLLFLHTVASSQVKALQYQDVSSVRVEKADLEQATLVADLRFYNPNSYRMELKDGDVDAYINDQYVGKALLDQRTVVPARDTFLLPVAITVRMEKIFTNALDLLSDKEIKVRLDGNVKAGKRGLFINIPVKYEGAHKINW